MRRILKISIVLILLLTILSIIYKIISKISLKDYIIKKDSDMSDFNFIKKRLGIESLHSINEEQEKKSEQENGKKESINRDLKLNHTGGKFSTILTELNKMNMDPENTTNIKAHSKNMSIPQTGKDGWCYVGNDRGYRSCIQLHQNDMCMSGDIFPSDKICVNPNLRM